MSKSLNTVVIAFFKAHDADVMARDKLIAAVRAARIKDEEKLRPIVVEAAAKHYGVGTVTAERGTRAGQLALDNTSSNYEAAKKAMQRAIAKVATELGWREAALASRDPVVGIVKKIKELDGRVLRRLLSTLKSEGLI